MTKSTVRAPISGIVTTLRVKAGEVTVLGTMNNPGTQLMTISDMSTVQAVLMVDETDTPPERIEAERIVNGERVRTRPLCAWPQTATYSGSGSTDESANFSCR